MKRKIMWLLFATVMCLGLAQNSSAELFYMTGSNLYKTCSSPSAVDQAGCRAYLLGVLDGRVAYMEEQPHDDRHHLTLGICIYSPKYQKRTVDELRLGVLKEFESHSDQYTNTEAGILVVDAVKENFPC